ncbi:hypothetical protein [Pseudomonas alkylphenolica]|uniref:hypothetical protein n=1 Tax=Pseudomonas alkylphenolica TaxID=237609 RepID=UPI000FEBD132|nr:hypothetical protein [Pseudomonas alkylphenolica]
MSATNSVLGVLGLCRVAFRGATHVRAADLGALRWSVVGVLGLSSRTRRRATFIGIHQEQNKTHANPKKLNKPNTLNSNRFKALNLLGFTCVGFVLGSWIVCRVVVFGGMR